MMWEGRHVKRTSFVDPSWFESSGKLIINDLKCTLKKKLTIKHFCSLWAVSETLCVILGSSEGKNSPGCHDIYLSIHGLFDNANQLNFKFKFN